MKSFLLITCLSLFFTAHSANQETKVQPVADCIVVLEAMHLATQAKSTGTLMEQTFNDRELIDMLINLLKTQQYNRLIKTVKENNLNLNLPNMNGELPLCAALRNKEIPARIIRLLVEKGAHIQTKEPKTQLCAQDIVAQKNDPHFKKMFTCLEEKAKVIDFLETTKEALFLAQADPDIEPESLGVIIDLQVAASSTQVTLNDLDAQWKALLREEMEELKSFKLIDPKIFEGDNT